MPPNGSGRSCFAILLEGITRAIRLGILCTLAFVLAAVSNAGAQGGVTELATGSAHWTIPPNQFGVEIGNRTLSFSAIRLADGTLEGSFVYHQVIEGENAGATTLSGRVTCMHIYDGNRAKIGGLIEQSNDASLIGLYGWFQVFDNGAGAGATPDRSSLIGVGDETANEAFCNSPNLPRFGPWDVEGQITVVVH